jgi:hypothetical protein
VVPVWHEDKPFIPLYMALAYIIGLGSTPSDGRRWLSRANPELQPLPEDSLSARVRGMMPRTRYVRFDYVERLVLNQSLDSFLPRDRMGRNPERLERLGLLKAAVFAAQQYM